MYDLWILGVMITVFLFGSIYDIRTRRISISFMLLVYIVSLITLGLSEVHDVASVFWGIVPGILWLIFSVISKEKMGYGDGIILVGLGIGMGLEKISVILVIALLGNALIAGILLALKKVNKKTRIPFIPFITLGLAVIFARESGIIRF